MSASLENNSDTEKADGEADTQNGDDEKKIVKKNVEEIDHNIVDGIGEETEDAEMKSKVLEENANENADGVAVDIEDAEMNSNDLAQQANQSANTDVETYNREQLRALRGDAIGDTMYSQSFVAATILRLRSFEGLLSEDEGFEKDLCTLWDMTSSADVTKMLNKYHAVDIFCVCVDESLEDGRLCEILLGILGNMCHSALTRERIINSKRKLFSLMRCITHDDPLMLIQLMRVLQTVIQLSGPHKATLYSNFCEKHVQFMRAFSFILSNSVNVDLLNRCITFFSALVNEFGDCREPIDCYDITLQPVVIKSLLESYASLNIFGVPNYETFANICWMLSDAGVDKVMRAYKPHVLAFLDIVDVMLKPFHLGKTINPFSQSGYHILDGIHAILRLFDSAFDKRCLLQLIHIWHLISLSYEDVKILENFYEDAFDNNIVDKDVVFNIVFDMLNRMAMSATDHQLNYVIAQLPRDMADKLSKDSFKGDLAQSANLCGQRIQDILNARN